MSGAEQMPSDDVLIQIGKAVIGMLREGQPVYSGRRGLTIDGNIEVSEEVQAAIDAFTHWSEVPRG